MDKIFENRKDLKSKRIKSQQPTPHKVNVGFYGFLQRFVSVYYVTSTYLSIFRSTMIKTQNKYKLSVRAKSPRTFSPTLTLYKTVVNKAEIFVLNSKKSF